MSASSSLFLRRVALPAASLALGGGALLCAPAPAPAPAPAAAPAAAAAPRCRPVILCGPSGVGKSTLIARLRAEFPDDYGFSVSHTTRLPRAGELHGVHYHFVVDKAAMQREIAEGSFLESADVHGNLYGTSKRAVDDVSRECLSCILDIDIQGVKSCRKLGMDVDKYIFVAPPAMAELERRLRGRGTETEERVLARLAGAKRELDQAQGVKWDAYIVNDDIDAAYSQLRTALEAGRRECRAARAAKKAA